MCHSSIHFSRYHAQCPLCRSPVLDRRWLIRIHWQANLDYEDMANIQPNPNAPVANAQPAAIVQPVAAIAEPVADIEDNAARGVDGGEDDLNDSTDYDSDDYLDDGEIIEISDSEGPDVQAGGVPVNDPDLNEVRLIAQALADAEEAMYFRERVRQQPERLNYVRIECIVCERLFLSHSEMAICSSRCRQLLN